MKWRSWIGLSLGMVMAGIAAADPLETNFNVGAGYRADDLDFNIAGNILGTEPNVLSELSWNDVESYQVKAAGELVFPIPVVLKASFSYGWIFDGESQDSDFLGDNRTFEDSRAFADSDDGNVLDASFGVGYRLKPQSGKFKVTPLAGFSYSEQNLTMTNLVEAIPPLGPFDGLDSAYETQWKGPWIGVDLAVQATEKFGLFFNLEFHWASYNAAANWNLREDFAHPKSFTHDTDATGVALSFGSEYRISHRWAIVLDFQFQDWSADPGTERLFLADGTTDITRLNEVNWESFSVTLGAVCRI